MAVINTETMDKMERVQFFVKTPQGGLKQLPFELITIDKDDQFYEPIDLTYLDDNMRPRRGKLVGVVILDGEEALPKAPPNVRDQFATWEYHGI